jgi:hypothetical protein
MTKVHTIEIYEYSTYKKNVNHVDTKAVSTSKTLRQRVHWTPERKGGQTN